MLHETAVLKYFQNYLGQRYMLESQEWYLDIVKEQTLPIFSNFYPNYIRNIKITEADAIVSYNPTTRKEGIYKYKIPNFDPSIEFIDIEDFYHPVNDRSSVLYPASSGNFVSSILTGKVLSTLPHVNSVYTVAFEPPDIVVLDPAPPAHVDFTVNMKVVRKLNQILPTYRDDFLKLALLDVKIALYNRYLNARTSGDFGGISIDPHLDDFSNAESDRDSLLEIFRQDSHRQYNNIKAQLIKVVY